MDEFKFVAFACMQRSGLDEWKCWKPSKNFSPNPVKPAYVSQYDLDECARCDKHTIWISMPGFMSRSWVNEYSKACNYKFSTGIYTGTNSLLLIDDIFKWIHRSIPESEVRTAEDIINQIRQDTCLGKSKKFK